MAEVTGLETGNVSEEQLALHTFAVAFPKQIGTQQSVALQDIQTGPQHPFLSVP